MMRRAVVVGSNGPASLQRLRYAQNDAERMQTALQAPHCGFEVIAPEREPAPTSASVRTMLYSISEACKPDDSFIFYFGGHGLAQSGALFLLLDDSDTSRLLETALPISHVVEALKYCRARNKLLILDCCHAGVVVTDAGFREGETKLRAEDAIQAENFVALMASDFLERACELESLEGGFMTTHVANALTVNLFDATGGRGELTLDALKSWLDVKWDEHTKLSQQSGVPQPFLFGQQKGPFYLTTAPKWTPYELPLPQPFHPLTVLPIARAAETGRVYCLGTYPVTNQEFKTALPGRAPAGERWQPGEKGGGEWRAFRPWDDGEFNDPHQPVTCVSLNEAMDYARALAAKFPRDWKIGLPSPSMWHFAAFGTQHPILQPRTWLKVSRSVIDAQSVTGFKPVAIDIEKTGDRTNGLGLSDMVGNVWEWCASTWEKDEWGDYSIRVLISDSVSETEKLRVKCELHGGSNMDDLSRAKIVLEEQQLQWGRHTRHANVGFRIAVAVPPGVLPAAIVERLNVCAPIGKDP